MNASELLARLEADNQRWHTLIAEIGTERAEQPGVNGAWSFKDIVGHLTTWQRRLVVRFGAALRGEPEPPTPWPASLQSDDDVNGWIYEHNRDRALGDILAEADQLYTDLVALLKGLPDDARIELVEPAYYLVWIGGERFVVSEFFNHFHDDHEPDVRAWMEQTAA